MEDNNRNKLENLPEIILNRKGLYEGNLKEYFKIIFFNSQNLNLPYHNFRHMTHVFWLCYQACVFYRSELTPRQMRNLLIASLFHDFNHSGMLGDDDLNIERAIRGLMKHILEEDKSSISDITRLIKATIYPYTISNDKLDLCGQILRDADMSQGLNVAWIQQVIFGLAKEWCQQPFDVLKNQGLFLKSIKFQTKWGQLIFPQELIDEKIEEERLLVEILQ